MTLSEEKIRELLLCGADLLADPKVELAKGAWGLSREDWRGVRLHVHPGHQAVAYCMVGAVLRCAYKQGYPVNWPNENHRNAIIAYLREAIPSTRGAILGLNDQPEFTKEDAIRTLRNAANWTRGV